MRHLVFIVALALLTGCKSHKDIVSDKSLEVDSVARSEHHRTHRCALRIALPEGAKNRKILRGAKRPKADKTL